MSSAPQHMMASAMESILTYDAAVVAEGCVVPALYIAADEPQPRTDMGRLHELLPQLTDGKTVGSGHFCQLEVPEAGQPDDRTFPHRRAAGSQRWRFLKRSPMGRRCSPTDQRKGSFPRPNPSHFSEICGASLARSANLPGVLPRQRIRSVYVTP